MFIKHFPQSLRLRGSVLLPSCSPPLGAQELVCWQGKGKGVLGSQVPPKSRYGCLEGSTGAAAGEAAASEGRSSSILCSASSWENSISLHRKPVCQTRLLFGWRVNNFLPIRSTNHNFSGVRPAATHYLSTENQKFSGLPRVLGWAESSPASLVCHCRTREFWTCC